MFPSYFYRVQRGSIYMFWSDGILIFATFLNFSKLYPKEVYGYKKL